MKVFCMYPMSLFDILITIKFYDRLHKFLFIYNTSLTASFNSNQMICKNLTSEFNDIRIQIENNIYIDKFN